MSNRLTFSLASLVFIFALAFATMSAMAHVTAPAHEPGHPVVTISEGTYGTGTDAKSRSNYRVKVVATVNGSSDSNLFADGDDLIASEVTVTPFTGDDAPLTAVTPTVTKTTDKHEWTLVIDLSTVTTARSIDVTVASGAVDGDRRGALGVNEPTTASFSNLSPVLAYKAELTAVPKKDSNNADIPGRYTVTLTFKTSANAAVTTDPDPEPTVADLVVAPMAGATAVDAAGAAVASTTALTDGTDNDGIYTQDYQLTFGTTSATLTLISGYATNAPSTTLDSDPADPVKQNPPMVTLTIGEHNAAGRWFAVDVMTEPALDTEDKAGKKITGAAIKAELKIMSGSTPPAEVPLSIRDDNPALYESEQDNRYRAHLSYGVFDDLPLTVSIDPNDLSDNDDAADVAPVTKKVGMADPGDPVVTEGDPSVAIMTSVHNATARTFRVQVTITPGMKSDGSAGSPIASFGLANLKITDAGDADATITAVDQRFTAGTADSPAGMYVAILQYNPLAVLPLTVTTADDFMTSDDPKASAMVPPSGTPPVVPGNNAPVYANASISITGVVGTAIAAADASATDADGDTLTYSWDVDEAALGLMLDTATGMITGTPKKAHTMDHTVTANDGNGGTATLTVSVAITAAPTAPGMPMNLSATPNQDMNTIRLTWDAPANPGSTAITGYVVTMNGTAQPAVMTTSYTTSPLAAGTYTFTVAAMNSAGTGASSSQVTAIINVDPTPVQPPAPGAPAAPTGLRAMVNADNTVTATWTEPAGTIAGYSVSILNLATNRGTRYTITGHASVFKTPQPLAAGSHSITVQARNAAGLGASASVSVTIAAAAIVLPNPNMEIHGTFAPGTGRTVGVTTLRGSINPNSFGVVLSDALPDLEDFFRQKGTIVLDDGGSTPLRTVVISEILWGLDAGEPAGMQDRRQFIELYNTNRTTDTNPVVNVTGWTLTFTLHRPAPARDIDRVSNAGTIVDTGWFMDVGQSGVLTGTTLAGVSALGGQGVPIDIISMYRNINYGGAQSAAGDRLKDGHIRLGHQKASWKASTRITTQVGIKASPGARHFVELGVLSKTKVPFSPFVINEIGNDTGGASDWIELRNVTATQQSLKNYMLSVATGVGAESLLFHFHDKDYKVPANGIVLVTSTDPSDNDLAGGDDIAKGQLDEVLEGATHLYVVRSFNLPDSGKSLLILRKDYNNKPGDFLPGKKLDKIIDAVGTLRADDANRGTSLWPLHVWPGPHSDVNNDDGGHGHEDFRAGYVYQRNRADRVRDEHTVDVRPYTGIGYDRFAATTLVNGGTPGYDNGALKHKYSDFSGQIAISEIMLATEEDTTAGRLPRATRLPQWVELYNNSMTQAVKIHNWHFEIQNDDTEGFVGNLHGTLRLKDITIQPNQTVIIVSSSGLNSGNFPAQRLINVFLDGTYRRDLGLVRRGDQMLNPAGFYIELRDHENQPVDEIGNLGVSRRTGTGRRDNFGEAWEMPSLHSEEGHRTSLIRVYGTDAIRADGTKAIKGEAGHGLNQANWRRASDTSFRNVPSLTYYGNHRDFGTPGYRGGGPLPVSLSKFRPERLDTGEVVIRWVTESELNNAGFNILRTEDRDGVYTQVNTELIAGHGTTSERNTYEWKDTTAKPNVVYYYQIQDVSLDGQVQTLRISRLKGTVSAEGKITTTWGGLKSQD